MRKIIILSFLFFPVIKINAQLEVAKLLGKNSDEYTPGFGASLKFGYPVSQAGDVNIEAGFLYFIVKESDATEGLALLPVKIGYRHTLNGSGTGIYIQPQVGYCVAGALSNYPIDQKVKGFIWAIGTGYLFQPSRRVQFDLGIRYESLKYNGGTANFIALRLSHNFMFGKRE